MTNHQRSTDPTPSAQENKVTITLIAVVVLFLLCQTPSALQLVFTMKTKEYTNMDKGMYVYVFTNLIAPHNKYTQTA